MPSVPGICYQPMRKKLGSVSFPIRTGLVSCLITFFLFQRSELQHKIIQFLFNGKNYVGPIDDILSPKEGQERCRVLDLGTGGGFW